MPIYEFECQRCEARVEKIVFSEEEPVCCEACGLIMKKVPSQASIVIAGNAGPKLRNRVELADELDRQGLSAPLYKNRAEREKARWALRKVGMN